MKHTHGLENHKHEIKQLDIIEWQATCQHTVRHALALTLARTRRHTLATRTLQTYALIHV